MVRLLFIQSLYNLSDEDYEYRVLVPRELPALQPSRQRVHDLRPRPAPDLPAGDLVITLFAI
jgi:hypothetical protein